MRRRVVVTGCGVVSPAGNELASFWSNLMAGKCFLGPISGFRAPGLDQLIGAETKLDPEDEGATGDVQSARARCAELGLAAARRALEHAKLAEHFAKHEGSRERAGVIVGTTLGEERQTGDLNERFLSEADAAIDGEYFTRSDNHRLATLIAAQHGLEGAVQVNATACSSGNAAIAWAYDLVASGAADVMIAGGADTLTRLTYCGFHRMGALSKNICRPFHKDRDGVSFGEGAGMVVLEEFEHARARGATILAELSGFGVSNDAYHLTAPEPNGDGFVRCLQQALATTSTPLEQIDYVSAHGTGTPYNDQGETTAIKTVLGEHAQRVAVSSIKSMIGHTNGAASAIETVACVLALHHQGVPPTANLDEPDPSFGLDFVPGQGRSQRVRACLNLAAGFGGFNVCLVLKEAS